MIYCIHHNDLDGRCSAAIVKYANKGKGVIFIEADYNKDWSTLKEFPANGTLYIVDYSLKPENMQVLLDKGVKPIWIDHHATAKDYQYQDLPGHRNFEDKAESGCELTWRYFDVHKTPEVVKLIGDYDKWSLKMAPVCFQLYEGLKLENQNPASDMWHELFKSNETCERIIEAGKTAIRYRDNYCADMCQSYGYETDFAGYRAYAANMARFGSKQFGERFSQYPFCIGYVHDGEKFVVSLYSETVDVGAICKKHGGGGHKGAAGFTCRELPFSKDA